MPRRSCRRRSSIATTKKWCSPRWSRLTAISKGGAHWRAHGRAAAGLPTHGSCQSCSMPRRPHASSLRGPPARPFHRMWCGWSRTRPSVRRCAPMSGSGGRLEDPLTFQAFNFSLASTFPDHLLPSHIPSSGRGVILRIVRADDEPLAASALSSVSSNCSWRESKMPSRG